MRVVFIVHTAWECVVLRLFVRVCCQFSVLEKVWWLSILSNGIYLRLKFISNYYCCYIECSSYSLLSLCSLFIQFFFHPLHSLHYVYTIRCLAFCIDLFLSIFFILSKFLGSWAMLLVCCCCMYRWYAVLFVWNDMPLPPPPPPPPSLYMCSCCIRGMEWMMVKPFCPKYLLRELFHLQMRLMKVAPAATPTHQRHHHHHHHQ